MMNRLENFFKYRKSFPKALEGFHFFFHFDDARFHAVFVLFSFFYFYHAYIPTHGSDVMTEHLRNCVHMEEAKQTFANIFPFSR